MRIAAVHHNYQRGADDEENLRDADDLKIILGSSLNLVLHGHTHEGKVAWLNQYLPVVSTGSAALTIAARPEDVPNQYQMIRVHADKIERWTRCFDPRQKKWIGDNRSSLTGNAWYTIEKVQFENVTECCPANRKSFLRGKLELIRELRSEQLIDDVVAQEYQRPLLSELLEL